MSHIALVSVDRAEDWEFSNILISAYMSRPAGSVLLAMLIGVVKN